MKNPFKSDPARHDGVPPVNILLLRIVYALTFVMIGMESWTRLLTFDGPWDHVKAVAFCVWAAYSALSAIGLLHPLKMLPLVLFQITYKIIWLFLIAYPLWTGGRLAGSPAEEMTYSFLWVVLPIAAVPWGYVRRAYLAPSWKAG